MRLNKAQKEALIAWAAEGLQTDEINKRAAVFILPFSVSRQQVDYYRKANKIDIQSIIDEDEEHALRTGLAVKAERVRKLKALAQLMEEDLFGGVLWTRDVKGVGSGHIAEIVEYEEFNKAEVDSYRGVLDDIAKEVGDRATKQELSGPGGGAIEFDLTEWKKTREKRIKEVEG